MIRLVNTRVIVSISISNTSKCMRSNEKKPSPELQRLDNLVTIYRGVCRMLAEKAVSRSAWPMYTEAQLEDTKLQTWLELVDAMPFEAILDIEDLLASRNIAMP